MSIAAEGRSLRYKLTVSLSSAAIILSFLLLVYFYPEAIIRFPGQVFNLLHLQVSFPWQILQPIMPTINVLSFLTGGVMIALIGREYVVADRYTYFSLLSYLFYFPLAGFNWQVFTTLSIFPTLFLLGFYLYKIEIRWASALFFILASATSVIYLFVVILACVALIRSDRKMGFLLRENYISLITAAVSLFILLLDAANGNFVSFYGSLNIGGYGPLLGLVQAITFAKPLFFIILLVPMITFAFFGPRVLPTTIPYYLFGIISAAASGLPEALIAILDLVMPLAFIGSLRWIGNKVEMGIMPTETRIIRFALFSLILLNFLVVITYFPFLKILATLLGL